MATCWVHRCGDHGEFLYRAFLGPPGPAGFPSLWGWRRTNPHLDLDATPSFRAIKASAAYGRRLGWDDEIIQERWFMGMFICLLLGFGRQISTIWMFGFCLCDSSCKSWQKSEKWWRGRENPPWNRSSFDKIVQNPKGSFRKSWSQGTILDYNLSLLAGDFAHFCAFLVLILSFNIQSTWAMLKTRLGLPGLPCR